MRKTDDVDLADRALALEDHADAHTWPLDPDTPSRASAEGVGGT
jgi:hypothetical protein